MSASTPEIVHSTGASNLADVLEMVLDKGVVIAGDIRIRLVEVELLTINIRLLIASVDKAKSIGIDWWSHSPFLSSRAAANAPLEAAPSSELQELRARIERLERAP
jgi:gas vesicle protein GvpA/GvpJ/GvpM family